MGLEATIFINSLLHIAYEGRILTEKEMHPMGNLAYKPVVVCELKIHVSYILNLISKSHS